MGLVAAAVVVTVVTTGVMVSLGLELASMMVVTIRPSDWVVVIVCSGIIEAEIVVPDIVVTTVLIA